MAGEVVNQAVVVIQTFILGEQFELINSQFFGFHETQSTSRIEDRSTIKGIPNLQDFYLLNFQ